MSELATPGIIPVTGAVERTNAGRKTQSTPAVTAADIRKNDRKHARRRNTLADLLNPLHHLDHKVTGFSYIVSQFITLYYLFFRFEDYESSLFLTLLTPLAGIVVTLTALRNFHFLPKKAENPGMFAENRTFSYAFLQENLWFQFLLSWTLFVVAPISTSFVGPWPAILGLFFLFYIREIVPKTSYTSWKVGNEKVNQKNDTYDEWSVRFINFQVKLVRWNYVLKKMLLYYMILGMAMERLGFVPVGSVTPFDRKMHYILALDAMHNITTAFFIQTLKFKGFISAFTFSMAFNASPALGLVFTYYLCAYHQFQWILLAMTILDVVINIGLIYPSKIEHIWKNRLQVLMKAATAGFAVGYYYYASLQ